VSPLLWLMWGSSSTFVRLYTATCGCATFDIWFFQICWDLQFSLALVRRCWVGWIGSWLSLSSNPVWSVATELDNFALNGSFSLLSWQLNEFKHHYKNIFSFNLLRVPQILLRSILLKYIYQINKTSNLLRTNYFFIIKIQIQINSINIKKDFAT